MAQISLIQLDLKASIQESPISAVAQDVIVYDTAVTGSTQADQHRCLCFRRGVDVQNPYALWEFTMPTQYVGTTGLTLVFNWWSELPLAAGAVVWEFAGECLTAA